MSALEERLLVALARRGTLSFKEFIENALNWCSDFLIVSDEEFVAACEAYADETAAPEPVA